MIHAEAILMLMTDVMTCNFWNRSKVTGATWHVKVLNKAELVTVVVVSG